VNVTVLLAAYCTSKGNSVASDYIDYVALGGIINTAGNAGFMAISQQ
jgi:hypothetical protein